MLEKEGDTVAWESRGGGPRKYFTRTRRIAGGFVREYYGTGPFAELKALELAQERDRLGRTARWRNLRVGLEQADKLVIAFSDKTDFLLSATLAATGYHNHRGAWRKRQKAGFIQASGKPLPGDIRGLIHEAQTGRVDAIEALRNCLSQPEIWQDAMVFGQQAEGVWLDFLARKEPRSITELKEAMDSLRRQMSPPSPSPIDFLLTERVIVTQMEMRACELLGRPSGEFTVPATIQNLLNALRRKAVKRIRRARDVLVLARQKLCPAMNRRTVARLLDEANSSTGIAI